MSDPFPREFFRRIDESDDRDFYALPRFVTHIDDATIDALTQVYRELVPPGVAVLDLMSSWVSHLPEDVTYARVVGHGLNRAELERNPRLTELLVQDLNVNPELPFADEGFAAALNSVSIQYLVRPVEVLSSVARVLEPGGVHAVAISHRMFPTKAVAAWHALAPKDRVHLVRAYFAQSGAWTEPVVLDRSPASADPLWVIFARRA